MFRKLAMSVAVILVALPSLVEAQNQLRNSSAGTYRADAKLVMVPVTVMDRRGAIVTGLSPQSFTILENKLAQKIASFSQEDTPVSIGVILDTSGSMKVSLGGANAALRLFLENSNPDDEVSVFTVSDRPEKVVGFTQDFDSVLGRMGNRDAQGSTALIDTIYNSLSEMRSAAHGRKALVVISDGMDNHSRYTNDELLRAARETDVQIHTISIYDPPLTKKPMELQEERRGLNFLDELSRRTGGLHLAIRNGAGLNNAAETIGRALRNQYVLGYVPQSDDRSGKWRSIQVKLNLPGATPYARTGYRTDP